MTTLGLGVTGCGDSSSLRIFAASSLQDVLPELLEAYAAESDGASFDVQYGGSQSLAAQIELGAEADLFISANEPQLDRLEEDGLVERRVGLAMNRLVVAVEADSNLDSVDDLGGAGLRIAVGAPAVPVGALTELFFASLEPALAAAIRANVITEDPNVRITLSRVELGEADAAFVYRTDLRGTDGLRAIEVGGDLDPNVYVAGLLAGAEAGASDLLAFLGGHEAAAIWETAGFEPLNTPAGAP